MLVYAILYAQSACASQADHHRRQRELFLLARLLQSSRLCAWPSGNDARAWQGARRMYVRLGNIFQRQAELYHPFAQHSRGRFVFVTDIQACTLAFVHLALGRCKSASAVMPCSFCT